MSIMKLNVGELLCISWFELLREEKEWLFPYNEFIYNVTPSNHLYNFKNVQNTHGGVLLLVKFQA